MQIIISEYQLFYSMGVQQSPSYKSPAAKSYPSNQARFQMCWESKILLTLKKGHHSYKTILSLQ
jgi:hypothetical protein